MTLLNLRAFHFIVRNMEIICQVQNWVVNTFLLVKQALETFQLRLICVDFHFHIHSNSGH
jgi:hypothetical protein